VSGTVEEVNQQLDEQPGLLNKSPESDGRCNFSHHASFRHHMAYFDSLSGWLCKIKVTNPAEVSRNCTFIVDHRLLSGRMILRQLDGLLTDEGYKAHCEASH